MDLMYLDNLEEYINDENKIVTYKWLSLTLNIPCNVSKQMLYHFIASHKADTSKSYPLNVTYLVSGITCNKEYGCDLHRVSVVKDDELEETKRSIFKKIFSIHVYSIQKAKLTDLNLLHTANYDIIKENLPSVPRLSSITCPLSKIKENATSNPNTEICNKSSTSVAKEKSTSSEKVSVGDAFSAGKENRSTLSNTVGKKEIKKNDKKSQNKGIAAMFSNQRTVPIVKKSLEPKKKNKATNTSMSSFVTKGKSNDFKKKSPEKTVKEESPAVKSESEIQDELHVKVEKKDSPTIKEKSRSINKPSKAKNKRKKSGAEDPLPKRSRILIQSDSSESESDSNVETDNEEPIPPKVEVETDDEDVIPPTPQPEEPSGPRGRKRKLVDKTFLDEEGFFVTKKEYDYVSEDEEPIFLEKVVPKSPPKQKNEEPTLKTKSPVKTKQASIMNFFKRK